MKFVCMGLLLALSSVLAIEIIVENPPPAQIDDPEWTLIPDEDGQMHLVNTYSALNEPVPFFNVNTGVIFELYTPRNPVEMQIIRTGDVESLAGSYFDPSRPTIIVIHGWNSRGSLTETFRDAYFVNGNHNVNLIIVNWQAGAVTINYISARRRVNTVGPAVSRFVDFLVRIGHLNLSDLTVIGHSLGAHVAGLCGKHLTSGRLHIIIGLDAASPLFSMSSPNERLAVGDAIHVESIHTAAGSLGMTSPLGDSSFYPNGGRAQPGCGWDMSGSCAHGRAHEYFAEGINSELGFYSWNCQNHDEIRRGRCTESGPIIRMGGDPNANGVYFLETNDRFPFARGHPALRSQ